MSPPVRGHGPPRRRSLLGPALAPLVVPRVGRDRNRKAVAVASEAGRLAGHPPLVDLTRRAELPGSLGDSSGEPAGPADRHILDERTHGRVRVDPEGVDQGPADATRTLDRIDDGHV